ncbi:MAG: transposase [Solirubrobacteraceae bacterium]
MPRRPREEEAHAIHHVFARGVKAAPIFVDEHDHLRYLWFLRRAERVQGWRCHTYCLMTNHVHLLVETPVPNLGTGMRQFHGDYGLEFNRRHGGAGHLFQSRFGSVRVKTDEHLITVARYIAENPVKAGLCDRPTDWRWSHVPATIKGLTLNEGSDPQ